MRPQAISPRRLLLMAGFALSCFGLLLYLWLAFGGATPLKPQGYRFHAFFTEATQLAQEADVRISGVSVGKVKTIRAEPGGRTDAVIELQRRYAPLPKDTKAILRQKTLLGEVYVELTPGDRSAGTIAEGGRLPVGQVSPTVELDEILRAFDEPTRQAFRTWMQTAAVATSGRGRDISDALGNLAPFAQDGERLVSILQSQSGAVRQLVSNTGEVFTALSERDGQLRSLIENSNKVFQTTAQRDQALREAFVALPTFESESRTTVDRLTTFAHKTNPLVTQLRPAARELSPTLTDLSALAPDAKALFRDLDPLITASKDGLPALQRFLDELHPLLQQFDPTLRQLNPILSFVGGYQNELTAFFGNVVGSTQATTADGVHYLRTTNPLNPENLAVYPRRVGTNRPNPYQFPDAFKDLKTGLFSYETRHCANGVPALVDNGLLDPLTGLPIIGQALADNIRRFAYGTTGSGTVAAPPCKQQPRYDTGGQRTQYPHVVPSVNAVTPARER
jgi:virulence factor Mce-like protein